MKKEDKLLQMFGKMIENAIENPELAPDKVVIISLSVEERNRILTPERIRLIRVIRNKKPKNVKGLASLVDRRVDAVSRDLRILNNYGFLEFLRNGKEKTPRIEKEILMIPLY